MARDPLEDSQHQHDQLREDISELAKETRDAVRGLGKTVGDLKEVVLGWKGDVEARLVEFKIRLEAAERSLASREKVIGERVNIGINVLLAAGVGWLLYRTTGVKQP